MSNTRSNSKQSRKRRKSNKTVFVQNEIPDLNNLINVVESQVDLDTNSYLISLHDSFQNLVHEFNTFSNDMQRVLNVKNKLGT